MQRFKLKYEPVSIREYSANLRTRKEEIAIFKKFRWTIWILGIILLGP